jgi:pilus assembly protein CpaF
MMRAEVYGRTLRHLFAPVARLLYDDETVTEVLINGPGTVYIERAGRLELTSCQFADEEALLAAVRNLAEYVQRRLDEDHHSMDARLPEPERFRVHVIIPPTSRQGVCVSIRKFRRNNTTLEWLLENNSLEPAACDYLRVMTRYHYNMIVTGGTGSGKTSLLNALSAEIPEHERIVVIEDSSELRLIQPHTLYLESRPPRPDGRGGVTIRDLFVDSLRMRPDRIIVGEVRRGEALDLIQSMLSGHDGSLSTVHASSPLLALVRLETLCLMNEVHLPVYVARMQVASAIQVIAQVARAPDGSRRVEAISEVLGLDDEEKYRIRPIFTLRRPPPGDPGDRRPRLRPTGQRSRFSRTLLETVPTEEFGEAWEIFRYPRKSQRRQDSD